MSDQLTEEQRELAARNRRTAAGVFIAAFAFLLFALTFFLLARYGYEAPVLDYRAH